MDTYRWAGADGHIVDAPYDEKRDRLTQEEARDEVIEAIQNLGRKVECIKIENGIDSLYKFNIDDNEHPLEFYACIREMTPGGRSSLKDEQRIQPQAQMVNYIYNKIQEGKIAVLLGVYKRENETIICAWKQNESNASNETTGISKQIKINSIAIAMKEGFVQHDKGKGEFACAFRKQFILFYVRNSLWLHSGHVSELNEHIQNTEEPSNVNRICNRIVFGAPGTGKSHRLDEDSKIFRNNMERVTFHPNYSYSQFVGTYKPVMEIREGIKEISYQYIPGPFMRVFLNAQKSLLINSEYKNLENVNVYYEPATSMEHWNLFEEIQKKGDIESFKATKDMKKGDIALVYIGNNSFGYDNGIYAIAKVISNPEIDESEEDGALRVTLRFDKISYDKPIISKEKLDEYNTQYQSVHRIDNAKQLIQKISFAVEDKLLLIEEINRANVAAVFGDVFQLLDRKNGVSEYSIATSEDLKNYLDEELWMYEVDNTEIRIPSNMFIWATMNSADQGVFPMDTAFKRRWEFEYIGIDEEEYEVTEYVIPIGIGKNRKYVYWNELRKKINSILSQEENRINEDKLLGPFFISKSVLENALRDEEAEDNFVKSFESKVIMYLFEDVMKMRPEKIFPGCKERKLFSKICEAFETDGEKIFGINDLQYVEKTLQE